ncbi:hypothetical protein [Methylobacterium sp. C1]|uniref:hypothetical protein n=1 Tax=Methylobacterium sp. C1 TaxID=1479019 RepID=UPI0008DA6D91|nr:hypothetical protein [Methylobacterium sp. C1]
MTDLHPIDHELLTALGDLPAREPSEDDLNREIVDFIFAMAAEPKAGSLEAQVLAAYLAGGETAAIEEIANLPDVNDDRLRDLLLGQAAATVHARRFIEKVSA